MRWKVELFHKILKSGCRAEDSRLRTAGRLVKPIAVLCILGWRLFWMTMMNRAAPNASPSLALTASGMRVLDRVALREGQARAAGRTLSTYLEQIAHLGSYLARAHAPPPGNVVMWRGWSRLMDIGLGAGLFRGICG